MALAMLGAAALAGGANGDCFKLSRRRYNKYDPPREPQSASHSRYEARKRAMPGGAYRWGVFDHASRAWEAGTWRKPGPAQALARELQANLLAVDAAE